MTAITPTIAVYDITAGDANVDAALLATWKGTLTYNHIYGWSVVAISNGRLRYTIVYD